MTADSISPESNDPIARFEVPLPLGARSISVHARTAAAVPKKQLVVCLRDASTPSAPLTKSNGWKYSKVLESSFTYYEADENLYSTIPVAEPVRKVQFLIVEIHPWAGTRLAPRNVLPSIWVGAQTDQPGLHIYKVNRT